MNKFRKALEHGLRLASSDKLDEAIHVLSVSANEAALENDAKWAALLAKNAGLLLERNGQFEAAKASYIMAVRHNESDPFLHYSVANICKQLGQHDTAHHHFDASYRLATEQQDAELLKVLEKSKD